MRARALTKPELREQSALCIPFGGLLSPSDEAVRMPARCRRYSVGAIMPSPVLARAVATRCTTPLVFADRCDGWAISIALLEIHPRGEGQQNNCKDPKGRIAHSSFLGHGHILTLSVVSAKKSEVRGTESGTTPIWLGKRTTPGQTNDQRPAPSRGGLPSVSKRGVRPSTRRSDRCRCARSRFRPPRS
jgi:hypothetical protein